MANNTKNVLVGAPLATGGAFGAPLGTPLPTDTDTVLDPALLGLGYVGEDGLTLKTDRKTDDIKAWGGDTVKVIQTEYGNEIELEFLESNTNVLKAVYGPDNVIVTAATTTAGTKHAIKLNKETLPHQVFAFDMKDGAAKIRLCFPNGQITEVSDVKYTHKDVIRFKVKIKFFPDAAGNYGYKYTDDGVVAVL